MFFQSIVLLRTSEGFKAAGKAPALLTLLVIMSTNSLGQDNPYISLPEHGLDHRNVAVLIQRNNPLSEKVGRYYQLKRKIPESHVFYVDLPQTETITIKNFNEQYKKLSIKLPNKINGLVLAWQNPYQVEEKSITSMFSMASLTHVNSTGQLASPQCKTYRTSPYYLSPTRTPWKTHKFRPAFMINSKNFSDARKLIDRSIQSDYSRTHLTPLVASPAYGVFVRLNDPARSSRWPQFKYLAANFKGNDIVRLATQDFKNLKTMSYLPERKNLMFYETGAKKLPSLEKLQFLPGAIADHQTSFAGRGIIDDDQTKAHRWLEAGATGTYGTVSEPCNLIEKFPNPAIFVPLYLSGETLGEAYAKSVAQSQQGLFMGDPLAKPFAIKSITASSHFMTLTTNELALDQSYKLWGRKNNRAWHPIVIESANVKPPNVIRITWKKMGYTEYRITRSIE
jgi:uncharacterized protein (TIGR03790 family)